MKQILLTGATGGIGQAIARQLAGEGHSLVLVARNEEQLQALADSLPGQHQWLGMDLTRPDLSSALAQALAARDLHPQILINNAGSNELRTFEDSDWQSVEAQLRLNLLAPMALVHGLLPGLEPEAQIINIGSVLGEIGYPGYVAYGAAKGGLKRFSEALGRELKDRNIAVSYLAPRSTDTPLNSPNVVALNQALGNKVDKPEVVAKAVSLLIKRPKANMVLGFPEKLFTRINALLPVLVDGAVDKQLAVIKRHAKETL
ncbi:SDR family oxidoreductase [Gallaecimonas kandeliae]|uniref:SDR family oxidoreductase n=1 Tax=Gallaecimonas kandeliae TaxID=3029055 RepID=UPI002649DA32|nr:SDR family oxidoreductase [Gallaecimonas kandeliae]WKE64688.1 SDR family oxidoreductase [Gallaecimonas kandeliae]